MKSNSFKSFARKNIVVIFLVILCLGFGIGTSDVFSTGNIGGIVKTSSFLSASNIVNLTTQMAINAMLSAGLTYVIILGGIDISVGSVAALAGIVSMLVAQKLPNVSVFGAILVLVLSAVVVGGICGAFNGIMITKFKVVPMITTLAMLNMARGLCFVLSGGTAVFGVANNYSWLGGSRFLQTPDKPTGWIPVITLFVVLCVFIMHTLLSKTVFGRHVYATGSNIKVAHLSGINTDRVTLICHILCAVMAALGVLLVFLLEFSAIFPALFHGGGAFLHQNLAGLTGLLHRNGGQAHTGQTDVGQNLAEIFYHINASFIVVVR